MLIRIAKGQGEDPGINDGNDDDDSGRIAGGGGGDVEKEGDRRDKVEVGAPVQYVQIDTGKTWREGVIRWFPR